MVPLERVTLGSDLSWTFNLPMLAVGASFTIDGKPAPTLTNGYLGLTSAVSPMTFSIWPNSSRVPPGSYDVKLTLGYPPPAGYPSNGDPQLAKRVTITGATTLTIDLPTRRLAGSMMLGGTASRAEASIVLTGRGGDVVRLPPLSMGTYAVSVVPGTYAISYFNQKLEAGEPANRTASLECITVK